MIVGCKHYVNGTRVPCPRMCPCQASPRPFTPLARRKQRRGWKLDGTLRNSDVA